MTVPTVQEDYSTVAAAAFTSSTTRTHSGVQPINNTVVYIMHTSKRVEYVCDFKLA